MGCLLIYCREKLTVAAILQAGRFTNGWSSCRLVVHVFLLLQNSV